LARATLVVDRTCVGSAVVDLLRDAIRASMLPVTVTMGQRATNEGGGLFSSYTGSATIDRTIFSFDTATIGGGGIYIDQLGILFLKSSTLGANTPDNSFGPYNDEGGKGLLAELCHIVNEPRWEKDEEARSFLREAKQ
jgi:hypothetical protein